MKERNKLDQILKARSPQRQVIKPVDVLETELPNGSDERSDRTDTSNGIAKPANHTLEPKKKTGKAIDQTKRLHRTVIDDLEQGTEDAKRATERYSFEIYTDQKGSIDELQYLYKKRTGKKLSASRIIREALEDYLDRTVQTFRD